jgi:HNH endonuclease
VSTLENKLVLAPAAKRPGPINFKNSVIEGIPLEGPALKRLARRSPETVAVARAHSSNGVIRMWGSLANKDRVWERVRRGDRLLFYVGGHFAAIARVVGKRQDAPLADAVWGSQSSGSWRNVIFLKDVQALEVPVLSIGALLGYEASWNGPREFFIPRPEAQAHALDGYDDLDALVASLTADSMLSGDAETGESYADVIGGVASDEEVKELLERLKSKSNGMSPSAKRTLVERVKRDAKLIQELKVLYDGHCQVCDDTFAMTSGKNYCEGAHIVALSTRLPGIDSYLNVVILCATCHKKLDHGGMRIFWDAESKQAFSEWGGLLRPLVNNKHIHTGWQPAP